MHLRVSMTAQGIPPNAYKVNKVTMFERPSFIPGSGRIEGNSVLSKKERMRAIASRIEKVASFFVLFIFHITAEKVDRVLCSKTCLAKRNIAVEIVVAVAESRDFVGKPLKNLSC